MINGFTFKDSKGQLGVCKFLMQVGFYVCLLGFGWGLYTQVGWTTLALLMLITVVVASAIGRGYDTIALAVEKLLAPARRALAIMPDMHIPPSVRQTARLAIHARTRRDFTFHLRRLCSDDDATAPSAA